MNRKKQGINEKEIDKKVKLLKKRIYESGLRNDFIAKKAGISNIYLSYIINRKRTPKGILNIIEKINTTLDKLICPHKS